MPPRSKKVKETASTPTADLSLPPVVFFLKVGREFVIPDDMTGGRPTEIPEPSGGAVTLQTYSDVLRETHESTSNRFDESIVHELISKLHLMTEYSRDTVCFNDCHVFSGRAFVIPTHYESYTNTKRVINVYECQYKIYDAIDKVVKEEFIDLKEMLRESP